MNASILFPFLRCLSPILTGNTQTFPVSARIQSDAINRPGRNFRYLIDSSSGRSPHAGETSIKLSFGYSTDYPFSVNSKF